MPTLEIVEVPIEEEADDDDVAVVAVATDTVTSAQKKRKITPMPTTTKKTKKSKQSSSSSSSSSSKKGNQQLTLGAFFGAAASSSASAQPQPQQQPPKKKAPSLLLSSSSLQQVTPLVTAAAAAATATATTKNNNSSKNSCETPAVAAANDDDDTKRISTASHNNSPKQKAPPSSKSNKKNNNNNNNNNNAATSMTTSTTTTSSSSTSLDPARKSALLSIVVGKSATSSSSMSMSSSSSSSNTGTCNLSSKTMTTAAFVLSGHQEKNETTTVQQLLPKFDNQDDNVNAHDNNNNNNNNCNNNNKKKQSSMDNEKQSAAAAAAAAVDVAVIPPSTMQVVDVVAAAAAADDASPKEQQQQQQSDNVNSSSSTTTAAAACPQTDNPTTTTTTTTGAPPPVETKVVASLLKGEEEEMNNNQESSVPAASNETTTNIHASKKPATTAKAASSSSSSKNVIVDYAQNVLKLSAGTRLEVQWQIDTGDEDDDDDDDVPQTHWWGATLLAFDGRCTTPDNDNDNNNNNNVHVPRQAIRVLLYDAYPAGGFHEPSREDVIFKSQRVLTSAEDERTELTFRLEASSKEEKEKQQQQQQQCADDESRGSADESYSPQKVAATNNRTAPPHPAAAATTTTIKPLSEKAKTWVDKKTKMQETYMTRAKKLLEQCREKLLQEDVTIPLPTDAIVPADASFDTFPDFAVQALVTLVEGANEPLSVLAASVTEKLNQLYDTSNNNNKFTVEMTTAKIKIVATRKNLVKNPAMVDGSTACAASIKTLNVFEDTCVDFMWRWEVAVLELLPSTSLSAIKKARSARKKVSSYLNAVIKLLQSLADSDKSLHDDTKLEKVMAKVSQEEERVLKYVRDEEKQRLAQQKKDASKLQKDSEQKEKAKAKQQHDEDKKREKEQKKLEAAKEKQRKKEEAAKEKQRKKEEAAELKRQKELEKEAAEQKEKAKKQALLDKQRKTMMSFFSAAKTNKKKNLSASKEAAKTAISQAATPAQVENQNSSKTNAKIANFDSESFRSMINSSATEEHPTRPVFSSLSSAARKSRRRRTKRVTVPVFVTVFPENPFEMQPFAEQKDVNILNKYKFFLFHEDVRPPYHGTWSKRSKIVTGRNPFGKDMDCVDYEADSEAEWEEGDDEEGEDLESPDVLEEEEKDDEEASLNEDGWLADDDELVGEETKALRKKQLQAGGDAGKQLKELTVCIVAPQEGRPLSFDSTDNIHSRVEGFCLDEAKQVMEKCSVESMNEEQIFLDAFPPMLIDEANGANDSSDAGKQVTEEDKKTFVKFIHNSTAKSKDKLIDALQEAHPSATSSRAQALRILDATAEKKKGPAGNVYWQVKPDVLSNLGLENLETVDTDEAHHETMRKIAEAMHQSTATSKDKAVDEMRRSDESLQKLSRAESMRLLEAVAEKKKHPTSGVYWEVKSDMRDKLGLSHLPLEPPAVQQSAGSSPKGRALGKEPTKSSPAATADKEGNSSDSASKKRKTSGPPAGSAKLLASFLKKQKLAAKP